jgi:hypothetical protein
MAGSFLHFLWQVLIIFVFVVFIVIFFQVVLDLFRSRDLSGWAKAGWLIVLIILPFLGVLIYLIARGSGMAERAVKQQLDDADRLRQATGMGPTNEIANAKALLDQGAITQDEFEAIKKKALS